MAENISEIKTHDERVFKLLDFLLKRLEQTLGHSQTSTRHIYLVNGAILAAFYFVFNTDLPLNIQFLIAACLSFLLAIVNWIHANFLHVQHSAFRAFDEEIRRIFLQFDGFRDLWPEHIGEVRDRILDDIARNRFFYPFRRTHSIYVTLHVVLAVFLLVVSAVFIFLTFKPSVKWDSVSVEFIFSGSVILSLSYAFMILGSLGMIIFATKFPFSTRIKDLKNSEVKFLWLNGYQVWMFSWIAIIAGTAIQLICYWL